MMRAILVYLWIVLVSSLQTVHEVIIIGAGLAGASASKILTERKIPHLMLESRNRTGGRIKKEVFDGITVDYGAAFIHKPNKTNPIVDLLKELNWTALEGGFDQQAYYYESPDVMKTYRQRVGQYFKRMLVNHIVLKSRMSPIDLSVTEAAEGFFKHIMSQEKPIYRDFVYWNYLVYGNNQGAEVGEISARQYQEDENKYDILPSGGFWMVFEKLWEHCKPDLKLNEQITEIDYSKQIVRVKTNKRVYFGRKVISSIPLGVLQTSKIKFIPALPQPYLSAFASIGQGSQNKLFVSLQQPFWPNGYEWLNFVMKNQTRGQYTVAFVYPEKLKNIVIIFLAGEDNKRVANMTEEELKRDVQNFLQIFSKRQVQVRSVMLTKWHQDPYSLGSYSYYKVGGSRVHVQVLRNPLQNRLWFVGEHAHPDFKSLTQAAFLTGKQAALDVLNSEQSHFKLVQFE